VMVETEDGFVIAERDLEIRGPGDFFGTRQSGLPAFRVANLVRDRALLERAREEAFRYAVELKDGAAETPLRGFVRDGGWEKRFRLARVG
jgi:ATP-dependent DNA helicase RecG